MNRRDAIKRLSLLMGGAIIGSETFLRGETLAGKSAPLELSGEELSLLDEIGETIIPTTSTPGAKAVGIGAFMQMMVNDCYDEAHQSVFKAGLAQLDADCRQSCGRTFLEATAAERTALLNRLDAEAREHQSRKASGTPVHYFRMLKQLTLLGYFTSEIGCTRALRYVEVPGSYNGNAPYQKGDRAWFVPAGRLL